MFECLTCAEAFFASRQYRRLPVLVSSYAPELILKIFPSLYLDQQCIVDSALKDAPHLLKLKFGFQVHIEKMLPSRFSSKNSPTGPSDVYFAVKLHTLKKCSRTRKPFRNFLDSKSVTERSSVHACLRLSNSITDAFLL